MDPNNNQWVYYNGELYHAGVKGMHWYQHLPGTDWWKAVGESAKALYKNQKKSKGTVGAAVSALQSVGRNIGSKAKTYWRTESKYYGDKAKRAYNVAASKVRTARDKAIMKGYQIGRSIKKGTSKLWNTAKGYSQEQINKFKESARKAYDSARNEVQTLINKYYSSSSAKNATLRTGKSGLNELESFVYGNNGSYSKACDAWINAKKSSTMSQINSLIQTTRFNIASGCAKFLDSIGLDDEVAKFLRKFK